MPNEQWLYDVFRCVDRDNSGAINAVELQGALSNGTWKPFNPETVRLMIRVSYEEFLILVFNNFN
ncbi:programmed cell death protein 6-like protein [Leptotrombidium deliense]|uniref:Programmed cell death protein 6-like protein n=1 Tax=Leptotrombidium deliense TaxID=299467 RepID=A0A443QLF9_9ACAR|nr:programmed cell death protein 6-like protein [Leptotrombidium deliense]